MAATSLIVKTGKMNDQENLSVSDKDYDNKKN